MPADGGDLVAVWHPAEDRGDLIVVVHDGGSGQATSAFEIPDARLLDPHPGLLPDARLLLTGRPAPVRSKDAKVRAQSRRGAPGARVFDASGAPVGEGDLGDGINHLFTTPSGRIWVAYDDQAIFGGASTRPGIVRFDTDLQADFSYGGNRADGFIGDCYALALTGEVAWACYYERWPLVRLDPPQVNTISQGPPGVTSLAVDGSVLAFVGGYRTEAHRLVVGAFDLVGGFDPWYRRRLCAPDGSSLDRARLCGRDDTIHAVLDGVWLRVRLADLVL